MSTLEKVREIIRAEVAKANPIEHARHSLELIAETSVRATTRGGEPVVTVVDENGEPRPPVRRGASEFTLQDLMDELRAKHPTLFHPVPAAGAVSAGEAGAASHPSTAAPPPSPAPVSSSIPSSPIPTSAAASLVPSSRVPTSAVASPIPGAAKVHSAPEPRARDWLLVDPRQPPPAPAADGHRAGSDAVKAGLGVALGLASQTVARKLRMAGDALRASVGNARGPLRSLRDRGSPLPEPTGVAAPQGAHAMPSPAPRAAHGPNVAVAATPQPVPRPDETAGSAPRAPRVHHLTPVPRDGPRLRTRHVLAASVGGLAVLVGGMLLYVLGPSSPDEPVAQQSAAVATPRPVDPGTTGSVPATPVAPAALAPRNPAPATEGTLKGVPEVIDTATLSIGGKVVPLFGVQWVRGAGEPTDLAGYLRGREVTCRSAPEDAKAYRCEVDGQDLSKVVLFNGGGRTTAAATPDLLAAEAHARSTRAGLWGQAVSAR